MSGYNIDLFKRVIYEDVLKGPIYLNPVRFLNDRPALPFFILYTGATYTFFNNNVANTNSLGSNLVSYYIGSIYKVPSR